MKEIYELDIYNDELGPKLNAFIRSIKLNEG